MATDVTVQRVFERSPAELIAMLGDPAVAQRRATAVPELDGELLSLTLDEGPDGPQGLRMALAATMPAAWLGGMAGAPRLIRTELWRRADGGYVGDVDLQVQALPVSCTGTTRVTPEGAGSALSMTLHLRVDIPVLGAMVEGKIADRIRAAISAELQALQELADDLP